MNLLYFSRIHYKFTLFFSNSSCFHSPSIADSVRIPLVLRKFTMNSLGVRRIHYEFIFGFADSLATSRKSHELIICFTMKSLSISWVQYVFIIYFANSLWINYLFREVTKNFFSVSRIHCGFIILFREFTIFYRMVCIVFTCLPWWNVLFYIMFILRNWNRLRHNMNVMWKKTFKNYAYNLIKNSEFAK